MRLLITNNKILRCQSCSSPIVESMHSEFKERFEGKVWDCETQGCRNQNKPERSRCINCNKCIPQKQASNMKESIFGRLERLTEEKIRSLLGKRRSGMKTLAEFKMLTKKFVYILKHLPRVET